MAAAVENATHLCFLSACDVKSPVGYLAGLELRGLDNEHVGRLTGVLIDAEHHRLRYLVVDAPGGPGRCCLVSTDEGVCLDPSYRSLRVATPASETRPEYDLDWLRYYSASESLAAAGR